MKPTRPYRRPYTDAERDTLRELYATHGPDHVAKVLNRPRQGVKQLASREGLSYTPPPLSSERALKMIACRTYERMQPTPEQVDYLRSHWAMQSRDATKQALHVSRGVIQRWARELQLGRAGGGRPNKKDRVKAARAEARALRAQLKPPRPVKVTAPKAPKTPKVAAPKPDYRNTRKLPQGKKPTMQRATPAETLKPWQYPMNSPQYKAWMESHTAGKKREYGIDSMNRPTVRYVSTTLPY